MTPEALPAELLPATQHYTLLAIATALYTVVVLNRREAASTALLLLASAVVLIPVFHIEMSVWVLWCPWSWSTWWTNSSLLLHGIAIALIVPIAISLALEVRSPKTRRKVRLEPRVRA